MQKSAKNEPAVHLGLFRQSLVCLLAFLFVVSPWDMQLLADQSQMYDTLKARAATIWGQGDRTITYEYDDNGSLISKVTQTGETIVESRAYKYNLQNRLAAEIDTNCSPDDDSDDNILTACQYNDSGIRTASKVTGGEETRYLIDPDNPTGYAQVLEEAESVAGTSGPTSRTCYILGDDVIGQTVAGVVTYMLYDGHGSVRQHASVSGSVVSYTHDQDGSGDLPEQSYNSFDYDSYGVSLNPLQGKLGYTGEQYDSNLNQYYLRARYYNPSNGRFNQVDPYAGNMSDPQSLHKYLYCHANPVNGVDPSGEFISNPVGLIIIALAIMTLFVVRGCKQKSNNRNAIAGAVQLRPGTNPYRSMKLSLNFLQEAVSIQNSGVPQKDVDGLCQMLQNGRIWMLPRNGRFSGYSDDANIYIDIRTDARDGIALNSLPDSNTNYTYSNYPSNVGLWALFDGASTLFHEYQHYEYGAGGFRETIVGSRNYRRTYGKEVALDRAMISHLNNQGANKIPFLNDKVDAVNRCLNMALNIDEE